MNANHAIHHRLNEDLFYFAKHAPLRIKDKRGKMIEWVPNLAQRYTHMKLEAQRKRTGGWVRALLLKGRQQGLSTYTEGRFYHRVRSVKGTSAFILSHDGKTTDKLFRMVDRYHKAVHPSLQPTTGAANRYQLSFPELGSDYTVGTAGNENVGRGGTAQLFHGSEVAYWEHDYAIQDGALESIALMEGTEIILESTANGPKGLFYDKCMAALKGIGDYILIFIPWFWQDEYEREWSPAWEVTEDEEKYIAAHFSKPFPFQSLPITREQILRKMAWRRAKCIDLATGSGGNPEAGEAKFRQIYPSTPIEAFQSSGVSLMRADAIMAARKNFALTDVVSPRIAGVDPAGDSDNADRTAIALRQGRHWYRTIIYARMRPMELAGIVANLIDSEHLDMVFIDRGYGEGTIDRLRELGYGRKVVGVAFNERTLYPGIYLNKRSEIIIETAKWLNAGGVRIPDDDDTHSDLASIPLDEETSNGLKFIKSKREIKKDLKRSTDILDAVALTMAYPVRRDLESTGGFRKIEDTPGAHGGVRKKAGGPLTTLARRRQRRGRK